MHFILCFSSSLISLIIHVEINWEPSRIKSGWRCRLFLNLRWTFADMKFNAIFGNLSSMSSKTSERYFRCSRLSLHIHSPILATFLMRIQWAFYTYLMSFLVCTRVRNDLLNNFIIKKSSNAATCIVNGQVRKTDLLLGIEPRPSTHRATVQTTTLSKLLQNFIFA